MPDSSTPSSLRSEPHLPLSRFVILDVTHARAGPTCSRHLADWGADVIKIEQPSAESADIIGARDSYDFQNLHRNKRMLTLNLKTPEGHEAFMRLAANADVVVENMRPDVKKRLAISYEDVSKVNPRIIYGSISGFGQDGPYGHRAGVDQILQGMGGLMSITGFPGQGPVRVGVAINDITAGSLLTIGILTALLEREVTGVGRCIDTSLLEAQLFMLDFQASRWLMNRDLAGQTGNDHPYTTPAGAYPSADGYINISATNQRQFPRFCDAIGRPEWKTRSEWATGALRLKDRTNLNGQIGEVTCQKPTAYWVETLEKAGIPCGPIYTIDQTFADPQVKHIGITRKTMHPRLGEIELVGSAINMRGVSKDIRHVAHDPAQDSEEILRGIGYSADEIAHLREKKAI